MSEPLRLALVGATGLVGRRIIEECVGRNDVRLVAIARREVKLPIGARMELFVARPEEWKEVLHAIKPTVLISALGSTWKKAGKNRESFRVIDRDLVLDTAVAAKKEGVERFVAVSSVNANPMAKSFYLRVKGETEIDLFKVGFQRVDILQPGLLRGARRNDFRPGETLGQLVSPIIDPFLTGKMRDFRSIDARIVAHAALGLAGRKAAGRFRHTHAQLLRSAREWIKAGERL